MSLTTTPREKVTAGDINALSVDVNQVQLNSPIIGENMSRNNTPFNNSVSSVSSSSNSRQATGTTILTVDNTFNAAFHNIGKVRTAIAAEKTSDFKEEAHVIRAAIKFFGAVQSCEKILENMYNRNENFDTSQLSEVRRIRNNIQTDAAIQDININAMRATIEMVMFEAWYNEDAKQQHNIIGETPWTEIETSTLITLLNNKLSNSRGNTSRSADAWTAACHDFMTSMMGARTPKEVEDHIIALKSTMVAALPEPSNVSSMFQTVLEARRLQKTTTYGLEMMAQTISGHTKTYQGVLQKPIEYTALIPAVVPTWDKFIKGLQLKNIATKNMLEHLKQQSLHIVYGKRERQEDESHASESSNKKNKDKSQDQKDVKSKGEEKKAKKARTDGEPKKHLTCNGCGRSHQGDASTCIFQDHPGFNKSNSPWHKSEVGKKLIDAKLAQYNKVAEQYQLNWLVKGPTKSDHISKADQDKYKSRIREITEKGKYDEVLNRVLNIAEKKANPNSTSELPSNSPPIRESVGHTKCTLKSETESVETEFFPDPGSLESKASGSYINKEYLNKINNKMKFIIYSDIDPSYLELGVGKGHTAISDHIYVTIEYKSRTSNKMLRASLKLYIIDQLNVKILIGKNDLLRNMWIESKHLQGYSHSDVREVSKHPGLLAWIEETKGIYPNGHLLPREVVAKTRLLQPEAFLRFQESLDHPLTTFTEADEEDDEYFEDDEDIPYNEGDLPTEIEGDKTFRKAAQKLNEKFKNIFSKELSNKPANVKPFIINIQKDKWLPKQAHVRPQSTQKREALTKHVMAGLASNLFERSIAGRASQVNMIPKKTEFRFTGDFRELNEASEKIAYPIPKIGEIMTNLGKSKSKYFAKLDLTQGFHQVPLDIASRHLSAFYTHLGVFQYLRMPQGTKGAPQWFQMIMHETLEGLHDICEVYIDDILIHGATPEELLARLEKVYERLSKIGMTANPKKTLIGLRRLDYLGYTLMENNGSLQLITNEEKRRELYDFPKPIYRKQLKSFLGMANVFFNNLKDYANITKPLQTILGAYTIKNGAMKINWTPEADVAYQKLKEALHSHPSIFLLNPDYITVLRTDASDYGCGAHLVQITPEGEERTIQFASKAFDKTQLNWSTIEKECYAVFYACKKFQYILDGIQFRIEVDHQNLTNLNDSVNQKVNRWRIYLQRFNATWRYIKGPTNTIADAMSRIVHINPNDSLYIDNLEKLTFLRERLFAQRETQEQTVVPVTEQEIPAPFDESQLPHGNVVDEEAESHRETIETSGRSASYGSVVEPLDRGSRRHLESEKAQYVGKLRDYIEMVHNHVEGHVGIKKTVQRLEAALLRVKLARKPAAPSMQEFTPTQLENEVREYIRRCPICQKSQAFNGTRIHYEPFVGSTYRPMECIQVDHIGPFTPDGQKNTHILVIIDTCTRWIELYPTPNTNALQTAYHLIDYIMRYGPPSRIMTDHGSAFIDQVYIHIMELARVQIVKPKPGDKESLAIVERSNKEIRRHLNNLFCEDILQDEMSVASKYVQRIMNNTVHTTTKVAPASLIMGGLVNSITHIWQDPDPNSNLAQDYQEWVREKIENQQYILKYMINNIQELDTQHLRERQAGDTKRLDHGSYVLFKRENPTKQQKPYSGPYIINARDDKGWYQLTSLVAVKAPFWAHANTIQEFLLPPNVNREEYAKQIAEQDIAFDTSGVVTQIISLVPGSTKETHQRVGIRYAGQSQEKWLHLKQVKGTEPFIKYCILHSLHGKIRKEDREKYATSIKEWEKERDNLRTSIISQAKHNTKDSITSEETTEAFSRSTNNMQIEESLTSYESRVQNTKQIDKVLETEPSRRSDRKRKPKHLD